MKKNRQKIPQAFFSMGKMLFCWGLCFLFIHVSGCTELRAQTGTEVKVSLDVQNTSLIKIIENLRVQSRYNFLFNSVDLNGYTGITVKWRDVTLKYALDSLLIGRRTGLEYVMEGKTVKIKRIALKGEETKVSGVVLDEKKQPMPGVTVQIGGTTLGTVTDTKGEFSLKLPLKEGTLIFSFVGFKTKKVAFTSGRKMRVILEENISDLDEAVVIGYGERKKRELVSSVSSVKADEIKEIPTSSFTSLLQGRMAGVEVTSQSGSPGGGGIRVAVRGYNSLMVPGASDGEPLYVIDGVPMHSFTSPVTGTNALAELDPSTIASVEVLKDAAAAAIYGSRAGNGVVLITTKKGKVGKANFTANVSYSASIMPKFPYQLAGREERQWKILRMRNGREAQYDWMTGQSFYPSSYKEAYEKGGQYDRFWNAGIRQATNYILQDSLNPFYNNQTNWWKQLFRTGKIWNANIQASGGREGFRYMVGMGYYTQSGIMYGSDFKRANFITNLSLQPARRIQLDTRIYLAYADKSRNTKDNSFQNAPKIESMTADPMNTSTLLPAGGAVEEQILEKLNGTVSRDDSYRMMLNAKLGVDIFKGLEFSASLGLDFSQNNSNVFEPSYLDDLQENKSTGLIARNIGITQENMLRYTGNIKNIHRFELLAGLNYTESQIHEIKGFARRGPSDAIHYVNGWPDTHDYGSPGYPSIESLKDYLSSYKQQIMISYLARIAYNYKLKYLMEATYRRDGSSAFGEDVRYANFPSVAVGWSFSEESFIKNWAWWLDMGKIRASWGTSGQTLTDPYLAHGLIQSGGSFMGNQGTTAPMINRRLGWEKSDQYDIGLDVDVFNYRLKLKMDYYYKYTKDLLYEVKLPGNVFGSSSQWQNAMEVSNEGIELELIADIIRNSRNWSYRTRFNISRNWNRFEKSYSGMDEGSLVIGRPMSGIYVYDDDDFVQNQQEVSRYSKSDGTVSYLQTTFWGQYFIPGMRKIKDLNGDGKLSGYDTYYAGSTLPVAYGGWVHELRWKNFDLNMLFTYTLGRKMINLYARNSLYFGDAVLMDYRKQTFWQKEGDRTDLGMIGLADDEVVRSRLEKVSYLRLKTLSLGYNLPVRLLKHVGLSSCRLFFTGENLFLWDNYSGLDPEVVDLHSGMDELRAYPLERNFTLGLTINF